MRGVGEEDVVHAEGPVRDQRDPGGAGVRRAERAVVGHDEAVLRRRPRVIAQRVHAAGTDVAPGEAAVAGQQQRALLAAGRQAAPGDGREVPQRARRAVGHRAPGQAAVRGQIERRALAHGEQGAVAAQPDVVEMRLAGQGGDQLPALAAVGGRQHAAAAADGPAVLRIAEGVAEDGVALGRRMPPGVVEDGLRARGQREQQQCGDQGDAKTKHGVPPGCRMSERYFRSSSFSPSTPPSLSRRAR